MTEWESRYGTKPVSQGKVKAEKENTMSQCMICEVRSCMTGDLICFSCAKVELSRLNKENASLKERYQNEVNVSNKRLHEINELEQENASLKEKLFEKGLEIDRLSLKLHNSTAHLEEALDKVSRRNMQIKDLEKRIEEKTPEAIQEAIHSLLVLEMNISKRGNGVIGKAEAKEEMKLLKILGMENNQKMIITLELNNQ